jgi:hypothetical protein
MRLEPRAFGAAAGMVAAVLFIVCALAVAIAPESTTAIASYLIHMDLSGMPRRLTPGSFAGGLIIWTLGAAVVFGSVAAITTDWQAAHHRSQRRRGIRLRSMPEIHGLGAQQHKL